MDIESKLLTDVPRPARRAARRRRAAGVVRRRSRRKRYPVVYEIPGFGGTHFVAFGAALRSATDVAGVEMLYVVLDPICRLGHHVFADSANNGPCGRALVEELIPHIEKKFRGLGTPAARFVTGHSSGGWSSLWLQVTYPDFFGGVWSTAPDPVDFRDFQRIDLYRPGVNMFTDADGQAAAASPAAAASRRPVVQAVLRHGRGHGPRRAARLVRGGVQRRGRRRPAAAAVGPQHRRDRSRRGPELGEVRHPPRAGTKLEDARPQAGRQAARLHGDGRHFLPGRGDGAAEGVAKKLGSDAVVELFPGRDHGNLVEAALRARMNHEMAERFRKTTASGGR